jgi:hypothetical protein
MTSKKYFYTYLVTEKTTGKKYIGMRGSVLEPKDDLGKEYFTSSNDQEFGARVRSTPDLFDFTILATFESSKEALYHEIYLHEKYDVGRNPEFYNRAKSTKSGFGTAGKILAVDSSGNSVGMVNLDDDRLLNGVLFKSASFKIMAIDEDGKILGHVPHNHPNVLCGRWIEIPNDKRFRSANHNQQIEYDVRSALLSLDCLQEFLVKYDFNPRANDKRILARIEELLPESYSQKNYSFGKKKWVIQNLPIPKCKKCGGPTVPNSSTSGWSTHCSTRCLNTDEEHLKNRSTKLIYLEPEGLDLMSKAEMVEWLRAFFVLDKGAAKKKRKVRFSRRLDEALNKFLPASYHPKHISAKFWILTQDHIPICCFCSKEVIIKSSRSSFSFGEVCSTCKHPESKKKKEDTVIERYGRFQCRRFVLSDHPEAYKCLTSKSWLEEKYLDERMSSMQIGQLLNVSDSIVLSYLSRHGIPKRGRNGSIKKKF